MEESKSGEGDGISIEAGEVLPGSGNEDEADLDQESEMVSSGDEGGAINDIVSEVDMRTSFVMTSSLMKTNNRRRKILSKLPKNATNATSTGGLLAIKIDFSLEMEGPGSCLRNVKRLICYGHFPWVTSHTM